MYSCQVQRILIRPSAVKSPTPTPLALQIKDFCNFLTFSWIFLKIYMTYTDLHTELFGFMCILDVWTLCLGGSSLGGSVRASARPSAPVRPPAHPSVRQPPAPQISMLGCAAAETKKTNKDRRSLPTLKFGVRGAGPKKRSRKKSLNRKFN